MARSELRQRALSRLVLAEAAVECIYAAARRQPLESTPARSLCESHERLRAELQGAEILLEDLRREVGAVVKIMDELSATWGDEGVFRRCRQRLWNLLPVPDQLNLGGPDAGKDR